MMEPAAPRASEDPKVRFGRILVRGAVGLCAAFIVFNSASKWNHPQMAGGGQLILIPIGIMLWGVWAGWSWARWTCVATTIGMVAFSLHRGEFGWRALPTMGLAALLLTPPAFAYFRAVKQERRRIAEALLVVRRQAIWAHRDWRLGSSSLVSPAPIVVEQHYTLKGGASRPPMRSWWLVTDKTARELTSDEVSEFRTPPARR